MIVGANLTLVQHLLPFELDVGNGSQVSSMSVATRNGPVAANSRFPHIATHRGGRIESPRSALAPTAPLSVKRSPKIPSQVRSVVVGSRIAQSSVSKMRFRYSTGLRPR